MKNIFKILLGLTLLMNISCNTDDSPNDLKVEEKYLDKQGSDTFSRNNQSSTMIYNSIIALNDPELQKLAFSALSPSQRYDVWMLKLQNFENNNNLNQLQQEFINSLQTELKVEMFTDNNDNNSIKVDFIATRKTFYWDKAIELFGTKEGRYLLTKIENINQTIHKINTGIIVNKYGGGSIRSCACEESDGCYRLTGVSVWGVSWEYGTCSTGNCYVQVYFGIWESDNRGRCKY